jgi:ribosomal protein S27AE
MTATKVDLCKRCGGSGFEDHELTQECDDCGGTGFAKQAAPVPASTGLAGDGWVSVGERLPEIGDVLCYSEHGVFSVLSAHEFRGQIAFAKSACAWKFWRPLPAPPAQTGDHTTASGEG